MVKTCRSIQLAALAVLLTIPTLANAQDISLATGGSDQTWRGTQPNAAAGWWTDIGAISSGDSRRDLIVGSPGGPGVAGAVYVIFGGPDRSGDFILSSAETVITSSEVGNRFGFSTAAGNILNTEGSSPRNLAVGAPGALGGRGAVYLFAGGFPTDAERTTGDAAFVILGATGDQLGTSLATADLDQDGHREIVIGAPGTSRVYVIRGGPSLSGTLDLSATPASRVYQAPGIGGILSAGDLTGDGVYDLVLGAPSQNLVYLMVGSAGTIPAGAAGSFRGIDAGDQAGTAIRVLDVNSDRNSDLVISAPGADGPANGRSNAGEVSIFFGPVAVGPMSLSSSDVTLIGAHAGARAGDGLATGDINRDSPNDLVILASGGAGGAGELDIYYGRSRNSMGTVQPDGRRVVDFSVTGQVNRRILGDPGAGPITSAQVFEVTGEGARDIIVGVAAAEAGAGKLYFTISPKLRISPRSLTLTVNKGGSVTGSTPIRVQNASTVFINWLASANRSWLSTSPAAGSADQTHPASLFVIGAAQSLPAGVHTGEVTVAANSPDLEMALPVDVTLRVSDVKMSLDAPAHGIEVGTTFSIAGWIVDLASTSGTGISEITVYAYPNPGSGQPGVLLGSPSYGIPRSDIGALYGPQFTNAGFSMQVSTLSAGTTYQIAVFAKSAFADQYVLSRSAVVRVVSGTPNTTPVPTPNPDPGPRPTPNGPTTAPPGTDPDPAPGEDTRLSLNRTSLTFAVRAGNNHTRSGPQAVTVDFAGGSGAWTVTSDAPWLQLSRTSGSGTGTFTASVRPGSYSAGGIGLGTLTIAAPGVPNSPVTLSVRLNVVGSAAAPFGSVDTPAHGVSGVVGAIPVTGWALDDVGVSEVTIWRDPIAGEISSAPNGKIFIGRAVQVDGARPDVNGQFDLPFDYRAGWGYLLLTNMLPNQGNGTFTLHMYAEDGDGMTALLGSRTITCDNANATRPFGSIDTPDQGGTVSGTGYTNFGWALTPQPNFIPSNGSTIMVFIDGVPVGRPTYNQHRSDIATLFPGRANSGGAVGFFQFDTSTLSNGVHTIAWGVTDNNGNSEGIGSRYFTVLNGSSSSSLTLEASSSVQSVMGLGPDVRQSAGAGAAAGQSADLLDALPVSRIPVYRRDGFSPLAPLQIVDADSGGAATVAAVAMERFQLTLGPPASAPADRYEGYVVANGRLQTLPVGAFLDARTGEFYWQPGVGFAGTYDLIFVRTSEAGRERIPLRILIAEK